MNKLNDLIYLFCRAWKISKGYFLLTIIKSTFSALLPLINIAGLGMVISALMSGKSLGAVIRLIIGYLSLNLIIALIGQALTLGDNFIMRKATNIIQFEYMQDNVNIDYHYVQEWQNDEPQGKIHLVKSFLFPAYVGGVLWIHCPVLGCAVYLLKTKPAVYSRHSHNLCPINLFNTCHTKK